jgi:hypothetical protein
LSVLSAPITFDGLFETVMAGHPSGEIVPALKVLPADDRQALLCTICAIHDEIARNSQEHGRDVEQLLESQCPLFVKGVATCLVDERTWLP